MLAENNEPKKKKKVNSIEKGKRGEREFAKLLRFHGFDNSHRGQQFNGKEGKDVVCPAMPKVHLEIKNQEKTPLKNYEWIEQARRDAKDLLPIVAMTRNHHEWLIMMPFETWITIMKESSFVETVFCPGCKTFNVIKDGRGLKGRQQYVCKNDDCTRKKFLWS